MSIRRDPPADSFLARLRSRPSVRYTRGDLRYTLVAAVGCAVLVGCMLVVSQGRVSEGEQSIFRAINGLSDGWQVPMWAFQLFGSLGFVAAAAAAAMGLRRYRLGVALAAAIPLKLAFEWWVVKALVERQRPAFTVSDAVVREASPAPLGFPSGHAIFAFVVAGLLAPYLKRRGTMVVYFLAVANSLARVYLGAHNPLDVVAGAALGAALAAGLNLAIGVPRRSD